MTTDRFVLLQFPSVYVGTGGTLPNSLREISAQLMSGPDPVPYNTVDWLVTYGNGADPDARFTSSVGTFVTIGLAAWEPTADYTPQKVAGSFSSYGLAPGYVHRNTLRDVQTYLSQFQRIDDNTLENLQAYNNVGPDSSLPETSGHLTVTCWMWVRRSSGGSSSSPPPRYLRMTQRDDDLGIERHPRLSATGSNGPTSVQSTRSPRVGQPNRYL